MDLKIKYSILKPVFIACICASPIMPISSIFSCLTITNNFIKAFSIFYTSFAFVLLIFSIFMLIKYWKKYKIEYTPTYNKISVLALICLFLSFPLFSIFTWCISQIISIIIGILALKNIFEKRIKGLNIVRFGIFLSTFTILIFFVLLSIGAD